MKARYIFKSQPTIAWFVGIYFVQFVLLAIYLKTEDVSNEDVRSILKQVIVSYFSFILPSVGFGLRVLIRYWIRSYRKRRLLGLSQSVTYSLILPAVFLFGLNQFRIDHISSDLPLLPKGSNVLIDKTKAQGLLEIDSTFRSIHVFGIRDLMKNDITQLIKGGYEQLVVVPYAYMENTETTRVHFNLERSSRRDNIYVAMMDSLTSKGIQLIIKPHIWIGNPENGKWRADISMPDESTWLLWEDSYRDFIIHYAKLSEQLNAPIYCIGNEFIGSTTIRPEFWTDLIRDVRKVYSGKLTYGANWDREVFEISFWQELDYIGIQAYFPLVTAPTKDYKTILSGWDQHIINIETLSNTINKPIIFTEIGYKSTENAAHIPWEWENQLEDFTRKVSHETQSICYQAFFEKVWPQDWMKGAWIWKWEGRQNDPLNHDFTPKGKSAYYEIAKHFSQLK
jgi:hypothetical protein